jgi:lipid A 4'-phosphatase
MPDATKTALNWIDRWLALTVCLLAVSSIGFYLYPQADAGFSRLFWRGDHFIFTKLGFGRVFTVYLHYGMRWVFFVSFGFYAIRCKGNLKSRLKNLAYIILAVSLSAGLVTNVILKDHWGRARPVQVVEFGGDKQLTPAWKLTDQCRKNCSFPGGDVSFAFAFLAPALLAGQRKLAVTAVCLFGTITALGRIAAGAHFLSDCVIGALLTVVIVLGLYRAIFIHDS